MTTTNTAMKPCPFCGSGDVSMSFSATMDSPDPAHRMVECENCSAMGESFKIEPTSVELDGDDRFARAEAVAAWNTRAPTLIEAATAEQGVDNGEIGGGRCPSCGESTGRWLYDCQMCAPDADARPASPEQGAVHGYHANRIVEILKEYPGFWRSCSGCQESSDGAVSTKDYPYDAVFKCRPGSGCSECGGLGVIWDDIDYSAWGEELPVSPVAAASPEQGALGREEIAGVIRDQMREQWDDICADTNCHPLDLQHGRGSVLHYKASHWTDAVAQISADAILALRPSASAGGEYQRGIEAAATAAENVGVVYKANASALGVSNSARRQIAAAIRALTPSPVVAEVERLRGLLNQALAACNYAAKFPKLAAEIRAALSVVPEVAK